MFAEDAVSVESQMKVINFILLLELCRFVWFWSKIYCDATWVSSMEIRYFISGPYFTEPLANHVETSQRIISMTFILSICSVRLQRHPTKYINWHKSCCWNRFFFFHFASFLLWLLLFTLEDLIKTVCRLSAALNLSNGQSLTCKHVNLIAMTKICVGIHAGWNRSDVHEARKTKNWPKC